MSSLQENLLTLSHAHFFFFLHWCLLTQPNLLNLLNCCNYSSADYLLSHFSHWLVMQSGYRRQILDVSWYRTLEEGRFCPYLLTYLVTWNWGNRNLYLCHCWNPGFTLPGNVPFRPHYCCLSKECREIHAKTQFALISWFLFSRYHDRCGVVNDYSCKSLKRYAGLEVHVDDTLGVISLINWRCHHSELHFWRNVWRIEDVLHHFLISKVTTIWYQLFIFQCNVPSLSFRSVSKVPANEKMERPLSTMSEASNYTGGLENTTNADSPAGRVSDACRVETPVPHRQERLALTCCVCSPPGLPKRFTTLGRDPTPLEGIPVPQ